MGNAKQLIVKPIKRAAADAIIREHHYSCKIVSNSQVNLGVFYSESLEGAMQFGPPIDKRKTMRLVHDTKWNGFLELNRMAFSDALPRNSESRALAIACRLIKTKYPHIEWLISYADASQCGDGTIYRASGFLLTGIKPNNQIVEFPDGLREARLPLTNATRPRRIELAKRYGADIGGGASLKPFLDVGAKVLDGFQLRYVRFLNDAAHSRLAVDILPYSAISDFGAAMYLGKKRA